MRLTLLLTACLATGLTASAQQVFFNCDFSEGFPEGTALFDVDGNEPSIDMKNLGFDIGTPWIITQDKDGNYSACSTSWYKSPGKSNDWMVTPPIEIASSGVLLRWIAKAADKDYKDGYSVYISETGPEPELFDTAEPLFSTKGEKAEWTSHEISLDEYVGKTVYLAFVNDSKDKSTLYIDDIFVGVPSCLEVESIIPRVMEKPGNITVSGTVFNTSDKDIKGFTLKYQFGDGEIHTQEVDKSVKAGAQNSFRIQSEEAIAKNETLHYTIWVECEGDVASVSRKVSAYQRRIVAEEVTGTWCGYCVRGIVSMREMKEYYGDSFLGIAVHAGSANWADPMEMLDYTEWLFGKFNMSGYPHVTVNRSLTTTGDPANIYSYYKRLTSEDYFTGLSLSADVDAETRTLKATTTLYTAQDFEDVDFRLAYVVVENDVHGEGMEWAQNNYYSDNAMGEMGGFEELPAVVSGDQMYYQDVARYISPDFGGIEGSLPSDVKEGVGVTHDYEFELPDNIMNDENTELAVLLINGKNGTILNAEVLSLKDIFRENRVDSFTASDRLIMKRNGSMINLSSPDNMAYVEVMTV
ncbi:MAG: choice-of-anchor J domain-containing protein, partial [Muribaculaceae bacterium]|nr:choice-of-anchor J domain-containing protein [Muribaculaceae bacterium]